LEEAARLHEQRVEAPVEAYGGDHSGLLDGLADRSRCRCIQGDRLLEVEVLPGLRRRDAELGVEGRRGAHDHGIDVAPGQNGFRIGRRGNTHALGARSGVRVGVGHDDQLGVSHPPQDGKVDRRSDTAAADERQARPAGRHA
jgi:hypothetical protein